MSLTLRKHRFFILSYVLVLLLFAAASHAFSMDDLGILKLSAREQAAVIRRADGEVHLVRVGETIGKDRRVIEIDSQRLISKAFHDGETVIVIVRLEDGRQAISTVKDIGERRPALYQPVQSGSMERP